MRVTKSKPAPKARQQQQRYDCTACGRTLADSSFPKHLPTDNCNIHLINTCKACLKQWIAVQIDSTTYDNITCPECPELMQNGDIKLHAAKDVYKRFDELERRGIADKTPGWRWCLAPRCRAGQVHEPPAQVGESVSNLGPKRRSWTKVKKSEAAHNICTCNECGAKACVDCDLPWHEGETCHDYQTRIKGEDFEKKEAASLKTIQKQCKQCPGCKKNIQRNGGCDHMRCTQCNTRFCFLCVRTYDEINRNGHGPGCTYAQPGRVDPHAQMGPGQMAVAGGVAFGIMGGLAAFFANGN